jgi:uncharacterized protein
MPKKFLRKYLPEPRTIRDHKSLQLFGKLLHDPNLWHLNRRSVALAFANGLFFMWMPVPFQMFFAAAAAIIIRANIPISVVLVWITNPVTMGPMMYFAYKLGAWILGLPPGEFHIELNMAWLKNEMLHIWKPLVLGLSIVSVGGAILGFLTIQLLWRLHIFNYIKQKRKKFMRRS